MPAVAAETKTALPSKAIKRRLEIIESALHYLAGNNCKHLRVRVLLAVAKSPDSNIAEIADALSISRPAATKIVRQLSKPHYAQGRVIQPTHGGLLHTRSPSGSNEILVRLTEPGHDIVLALLGEEAAVTPGK